MDEFVAESNSRLAAVLHSKLIIGILAGIVVVGLAWLFAFYEPQNHHLSNLKSKQSQLLATEQSLRIQLDRLRYEVKALPLTCANLERDEAAIPDGPHLASFYRQISALAFQTGISAPSISATPGGTPSKGAPYQTISVSMAISGTYAQIINFINGTYDLKTLKRLMVINSLDLRGGPIGGGISSYQASLSATLYYTTTPTPTSSSCKISATSSTPAHATHPIKGTKGKATVKNRK